MVEGIRATLAGAANWCGGRLFGADGEFAGVSTDSRRIAAGQLFVALRGERHNGHDHAAGALALGAAAVVVDHRMALDGPQIVVGDTRLALGALASGWRGQLALSPVAVTGSNGKTTVKEMLASILRQEGPGFATEGNFNNDIGVPLMLFRLSPEHRWAVLELGANHHGEIDYLTKLVSPAVALITNAGPAHLDGFGSIDGVAQAKGEIYGGLPADGTAVINADSPYAPLWRELAAGRRIISFGIDSDADVSAVWAPTDGGSRLQLALPDAEVSVALPLPGRHNVMNALAAAAAATALGVPAEHIGAGLESVAAVPGRLRFVQGENGARVIDDTYNANPASLRAGIEVLAGCGGRRVLALGDMAELGPTAPELHAEAGRMARQMEIERLYATGPLSCHAAESFGPGGRCFDSAEDLAAALRPELDVNTTVLVKGSRSVRMERVVTALAGEND
jgi:UDP-N-acetylmuramoyl-tripeptide--D-alanyl-D-alanine ligase